MQTWLSHFTDEKTEAQGEEAHPESHRVTERDLSAGLCPSHSSLHWSLPLSMCQFQLVWQLDLGCDP